MTRHSNREPAGAPGAAMRGGSAGRGRAAGGAAARLVAYLQSRGGSVESLHGQGITRELADAIGGGTLSALNALLGRLERKGVLVREVRGRRTYRVALTEDRPAPPRGAGSQRPVSDDDLSHPGAFLRAAILFILSEGAAHGYEVTRRLAPFGFTVDDTSRVYRTLRSLEKSGLVWADWQTPARGPARRAYDLTPAGTEALERDAGALQARIRLLQAHLDRYAGSHESGGGRGGRDERDSRRREEP